MAGDADIKKVDSFLSRITGGSLSKEHREEGEKHKALLTDAIEDLEREMGQLAQEKEELDGSLKQTSEDMNLTQSEEAKLRNKIASLINKESELSSKKLELQEKLDKLKSKMAKVGKIKDELKEL